MKTTPDEITLEDYDEVTDEYEIRASREKYELESAKLLAYIKEREDLVKLLKIAKPQKIAAIRELIASFDSCIDKTEKIIALSYEMYQSRQDMWRQDMELMAMTDAIKPELLKYVAEHKPEKLEELEAMLSDDDKTH